MERAKALPREGRREDEGTDALPGGGARHDVLQHQPLRLPAHRAAKGKKYVSLLSDQEQIAANLTNFIAGFSANAREIFLDKFKFGDQINRLDEANLLYLVLSKFTEIDLHPDVVDNIEMGYIFEELIRRFSEASNETAGEHFTPREVIRLMVNLLFIDDSEALTKKGVIRTLYDPACGTGRHALRGRELPARAQPQRHAQGLRAGTQPRVLRHLQERHAHQGRGRRNIKFGNSFTQDGLPGETFDYFLSNPPFGVEWKKVEKEIRDEHEKLGMAGASGRGCPASTTARCCSSST